MAKSVKAWGPNQQAMESLESLINRLDKWKQRYGHLDREGVIDAVWVKLSEKYAQLLELRQEQLDRVPKK